MTKPRMENLAYRGTANLETIACPLCAGTAFTTLVIEQTIPVVRCHGCGLVFANPRPDRQGLLEFYESYFPPESESLWQEQMAQVFLKEGLRKIDALRAANLIHVSSPPRIFDIGCGMGYFLDLMRQHGWDTMGVEPAPAACRYARDTLGLNVVEGTIESVEVEESFDVVTLWYVLEHVPNPGEILDRAAALLHPGGLLIVRVPNQSIPIDRALAALGLQRFFLMNPPRHLFDYSPRTLAMFLERSGFEMNEIRNSIPRASGTPLERLRRHVWYWLFRTIYVMSAGRILRGSSMTVYATKKA